MEVKDYQDPEVDQVYQDPEVKEVQGQDYQDLQAS